ncbi:MAG: hypothetical protein M1838_002168, partial [Thelocarpon superellum]
MAAPQEQRYPYNGQHAVGPQFHTTCVDPTPYAAEAVCSLAVHNLMGNLTGSTWDAANPNDADVQTVTIQNNTHYSKTDKGDPSQGGRCLVNFLVATTTSSSLSASPSDIYHG